MRTSLVSPNWWAVTPRVSHGPGLIWDGTVRTFRPISPGSPGQPFHPHHCWWSWKQIRSEWDLALEESSVAKAEELTVWRDGGRPLTRGCPLSTGTAPERARRDLHSWSGSVCRPSHPALPPRSSPRWCLRKLWVLPWTASNGHISPEGTMAQPFKPNRLWKRVCAHLGNTEVLASEGQ